LVEILPTMTDEQIDKLNSVCITPGNYYTKWDDSVFHCSDEMDWKESECCWTIIRNGLCSECKENC
jgi:hypothetical protein